MKFPTTFNLYFHLTLKLNTKPNTVDTFFSGNTFFSSSFFFFCVCSFFHLILMFWCWKLKTIIVIVWFYWFCLTFSGHSLLLSMKINWFLETKVWRFVKKTSSRLKEAPTLKIFSLGKNINLLPWHNFNWIWFSYSITFTISSLLFFDCLSSGYIYRFHIPLSLNLEASFSTHCRISASEVVYFCWLQYQLYLQFRMLSEISWGLLTFEQQHLRLSYFGHFGSHPVDKVMLTNRKENNSPL